MAFMGQSLKKFTGKPGVSTRVAKTHPDAGKAAISASLRPCAEVVMIRVRKSSPPKHGMVGH
jgi:hypothetical protein